MKRGLPPMLWADTGVPVFHRDLIALLREYQEIKTGDIDTTSTALQAYHTVQFPAVAHVVVKGGKGTVNTKANCAYFLCEMCKRRRSLAGDVLLDPLYLLRSEVQHPDVLTNHGVHLIISGRVGDRLTAVFPSRLVYREIVLRDALVEDIPKWGAAGRVN